MHTPVHVWFKAADVLIEAGANFNARDRRGRTVVKIAAINGNAKVRSRRGGKHSGGTGCPVFPQLFCHVCLQLLDHFCDFFKTRTFSCHISSIVYLQKNPPINTCIHTCTCTRGLGGGRLFASRRRSQCRFARTCRWIRPQQGERGPRCRYGALVVKTCLHTCCCFASAKMRNKYA